jgi:hypothetical protein
MKFKTIDLIGQSFLYLLVITSFIYENYSSSQPGYNNSLPGLASVILFFGIGTVQLISGFWYIIENFCKPENRKSIHTLYTVTCVVILALYYLIFPILMNSNNSFSSTISPLYLLVGNLFLVGGFTSFPIYVVCIFRFIRRNKIKTTLA